MFALITVGRKITCSILLKQTSQRYWFPVLEGYKEFRAIVSLFFYILLEVSYIFMHFIAGLGT